LYRKLTALGRRLPGLRQRYAVASYVVCPICLDNRPHGVVNACERAHPIDSPELPRNLDPSNLRLSQDTDPSDRCAGRLLVRLGLLEDASPLFGSVAAVSRAGVLMALPVLGGHFYSAA
jgi:hypothetical protein